MAEATGSGKTMHGRDGACATLSLLLIGALLTGSGGSHVISIGVILPFDSDEPWSLRLAGPAIRYAVASVQRSREGDPADGRRMTSVSLRQHVLRVQVNDSRCSDTWGPLSAFDMFLSGRANVFVGPVCEYAVAAVARYSPHWDIPVITPGALVLDFDDRARYQLLTRISGSYSKLAESLSALMRRFSWRPGAVGLVYQQRERKQPSASKSTPTLGNSDCFFVMQAVHSHLEALRHRPTVAVSNSTSAEARVGRIWYQSIMRNALNAEKKLREIALHARSKFTSDLYKQNHKDVVVELVLGHSFPFPFPVLLCREAASPNSSYDCESAINCSSRVWGEPPSANDWTHFEITDSGIRFLKLELTNYFGANFLAKSKQDCLLI